MYVKMNVRNWLFNNIVPRTLLRKMVMARVAGKGVALMYHEVLPDGEGLAAWTVVKASDFKEQMSFLKKYFDVVTIDEALMRVASSERYPKPFAVVTFDDGYKGNLTCVLPIIEELKIPVTVYIASQSVERGTPYWYDRIIALLDHNKEMTVNLTKYGLGQYELKKCKNEKVNWSVMQQLLTALKTLLPQLREEAVDDILGNVANMSVKLEMLSVEDIVLLSSSPFVTIGGHSHCHNILPQLSDVDLKISININRNKLIKWTKQDIVHFSYPNGDFDKRVTAAVKNEGYVSAVTTKGKQWTMAVNAFELPRYGVGRFDSLGLFIARLGQLV